MHRLKHQFRFALLYNMIFDYQQFKLPIAEVVPSIQHKLIEHNTLIVHAPPGAGKSTLIPLTLLEEDYLKGKKIILLEPRRLAAKTIAHRMSDMLGENTGQTVGYRIRFETKVSENTRIEVVTEGILTRMLHTDNALEGVGMVIFDEFHERSIHADTAMALCRETQQVLRQDLRILVMSATLNVDELTHLLGAPLVESKGRQYPVDVKYAGDCDPYMISEMTARTVSKAVKTHEGDCLVFLPGQGEIRKCEELLRRTHRDFAIYALYGNLPPKKQFAAIMPNRDGKRKIVLATSIAETSLTIEGVRIVVDCGFGRTQKFDPNSGLTRLETIRISMDSADQRAGRAGRLTEGVCYRMWSNATEKQMDKHRTPEILEADLASLTLDMALWGIQDINQLTWLDVPPAGNVQQAMDLLESLDAVEHGKITDHGKALHRLPTHPRIAQLLLIAEEDGMPGLACDIAAVLEERDPLGREAGIDLNSRLEALRSFRSQNKKGGPFEKIERIASSYRSMLKIDIDNGYVDPYETGILLAQAYPERIACARPGNNAQFQLANGRYAMAGHKDDLAHDPWLAVAHLDARDGMGKIFMASPLNPQDLAPLVKDVETITWDTRKGGLIASQDLRIGNIILKSTPLPEPDPSHLITAICDVLKKEGERLLDWNEEVVQWQNRILSLRKWNPSDGWPDVSIKTLLVHPESWIGPYLDGVKKPEDLKKLNLTEILKHSLDFDLQKKSDALTPSKVQVPSGSWINIDYQAYGKQPVLSVRLQEVFGLEDTPTVNDGKISLLMHLLSPGFKPVQITSDLRNFWNNTYFEVKKDLKGRYPKHHWPEDPWVAEPVRGAKRRKPS